jgi:hypothetical protein
MNNNVIQIKNNHNHAERTFKYWTYWDAERLRLIDTPRQPIDEITSINSWSLQTSILINHQRDEHASYAVVYFRIR